MRIFYDTEFTDLMKGARLLSAGFVSELGPELYLEFSGVPDSACSEFVLTTVKPLLGAPGVPCLPEHEALAHIMAWLAAQGDDVTLVSDSEWDSTLVGGLMRANGIPATAQPRFRLLSFVSGFAARRYQEADLEYFLRNPGMRHHALHDARAMRDGVLRGEGFY